MGSVLGGQVSIIDLFSRFWQLMGLYGVLSVGLYTITHTHAHTLSLISHPLTVHPKLLSRRVALESKSGWTCLQSGMCGWDLRNTRYAQLCNY